MGNPISPGKLNEGVWDPITAENLDQGGNPISAGNIHAGESHICRKPRWGGSHICRKPRWGDPISAANLEEGSHTYGKPDVGSHIYRNHRWGGGGDPISAGNPDGGDPISAGNLDCASHICRKPRWGWISYIQEARCGIPYLQET